MIDQAVSTFGKLDVLINNAGILRDRMLVNMTEEEWDAVIKVHLKGTFAPAHHAAAYWRDRNKATGEQVGGRIINTSSVSGIYGNIGQQRTRTGWPGSTRRGSCRAWPPARPSARSARASSRSPRPDASGWPPCSTR